MPRVWLSIGSNLDREQHIRGAVRALRAEFPDLILSRVYESPPVGFEGALFFNLVVGFFTELPVERLVERLRAIETAHGRVRQERKFVSRTLDIDLLTYGDQVLNRGGIRLPREEITQYSFVLLPLSEVAGEERHPVNGKSFRELWQAFDAGEQPLWPSEFQPE